MPVYRTPDGKIVEEKTVKEDATTPVDIPPPPGGRGGGALDPSYDAPTQRVGEGDAPQPPAPDGPAGPAPGAGKGPPAAVDVTADADDEPKTHLAGARRRKAKPVGEEGPGKVEATDAMDDPVVGWVVVIDGPGQGNSLTLGYGTNSLGRSPDQRLHLDYGDDQISRQKHAVVTYDPRSRKYFVQHGGGKNLTYLKDKPVLDATELSAGDEIQVGGTTLKFVPFCGADFDWQDKEGDA